MSIEFSHSPTLLAYGSLSLLRSRSARSKKKTFSSEKKEAVGIDLLPFSNPARDDGRREEVRLSCATFIRILGNWFRGDVYSPGIEGVCKRGGSSLSFCFHPPIHSHSTWYLPLIIVQVFTRHLADSIYPCFPLHSSSLMLFASCKEDIPWPSSSLSIWPKETKRFLASPLKCAVYPQNDFG